MKDMIQNFWGALLAAVAGAMVMCFIFTGALTVSTGMAGFYVRTYAREESVDAEDLVAAVHLRSGETLAAEDLIKSLSGQEYGVRVRKVELCSGADAGRDVTEKAVSEAGSEVTFPKSGAYRVSLYVGRDRGAYTEETLYYAVEEAGPAIV